MSAENAMKLSRIFITGKKKGEKGKNDSSYLQKFSNAIIHTQPRKGSEYKIMYPDPPLSFRVTERHGLMKL